MNLNFQKFWKKRSVTITEYDPTYKVVYLGNVLTAWAKGEGCAEKPLATLWKNYCQNAKADVIMKVTVGNSGLKAVTKEHGLTEYWANRITYCGAPSHYPRVFCWVYRHEGKRLRQELRCHAVLCTKGEHRAYKMAAQLQLKLAESLQEFRREKISRQNARLSLANCVYDNPSLPRRKILLCTGSANYRPPMERSKSAPKLMSIEESVGEDVVSNKSFDEFVVDDECRLKAESEQRHNHHFGGRVAGTTTNLRGPAPPPPLRHHHHLFLHHQATTTTKTTTTATNTNNVSKVHFDLSSSYQPSKQYNDGHVQLDEDEEDIDQCRHRVNLVNSPIDRDRDDEEEENDDEDDDDERVNDNELDDIEVCLFDPNGSSASMNNNRQQLLAAAAALQVLQPVEGDRMNELEDVNMSSSCGSTSTSSSTSASPTSLRGIGGGREADDIVSDESGYSEENNGGGGGGAGGVRTAVRSGASNKHKITCTCAI